METIREYGHWGATFLMIVIASAFLLGFVPLSKKNWRQLGMTEAFIVALYTEMYGLSLTVYLLSAILGSKIPFTHVSGHLWATLFGWGEKGAMIEMFIGDLALLLGAGLVIVGWKKIYKQSLKTAFASDAFKLVYQAKAEELVTDGIYAHIRHPQYTGIILATFGTLVHWPTLLTFFLWPILIYAYLRLARTEEKEMIKRYGARYKEYQGKVPMFIPSLSLVMRVMKAK